jgi:hypothetical protein
LPNARPAAGDSYSPVNLRVRWTTSTVFDLAERLHRPAYLLVQRLLRRRVLRKPHCRVGDGDGDGTHDLVALSSRSVDAPFMRMSSPAAIVLTSVNAIRELSCTITFAVHAALPQRSQPYSA